MGDIRYQRSLRRITSASERTSAIRQVSDEDIVQALAAVSTDPESRDPLLANVLATEALNRIHRTGMVLQAASEGIIAVDASGNVVLANPAVSEILGWNPGEIKGRDIHETLHLHDRDAHYESPESCAVLRTLSRGEPFAEEGEMAHRDGSRVPVAFSCAPLMREGEVDGAALIFLDITAQKLASARRRARHQVVQILATPSTIEEAARGILRAIGEGFGWEAGAFWLMDAQGEALRCAAFWKADGLEVDDLERVTREARFRPGEGVPGVVWQAQEPFWMTDIADLNARRFRRMEFAIESSMRAVFGFPCLAGRTPRAVIEFYSRHSKAPDDALFSSVESIGSEVGAFIERKASEARIFESETRKSGMLRAALDAVVAIDAQGRIIEFNPAAEHTFGFSAEEVLGKDLYNTIVPHRYRGRHRQGMERYLETGEGPILGKLLELPAIRKDGTEFPVELYIVPVKLPDRTIFTSSMRDITDRKRAEAAREEANRRVTSILESITDAFFAVDRDWRFTYVNATGTRLLFRQREELVGKNLWDAFPQAIGTTFFRRYHDALQSQLPAHFEEFYPPLDAWFEVHAYPAEDGLSVFFRDVTERRRMEDALRDERNRLRVVLEALPVGVFIANAAGEIVHINAATREIWGKAAPLAARTREYAKYRGWWAASGEPIAAEEWALARALRHGETSMAEEVVIENFDRVRRTILNSAVPLRDERGQVTGAVVVNVDITERKRMEEDLRQQELLHRLALETTGLGTWAADPQTGMVTLSERSQEILGMDQERVKYEDYLGRIHEEDREVVRRRVLEALTPGSSERYEAEFRVLRPDAPARRVRSHGRLLHRDDRPPMLVGTFQDVTATSDDETRSAP